MRRVVITGMGAVTPVGNDVATTWRNLVAGTSGISRLRTFAADTFPVRIGGQVSDLEIPLHLQAMSTQSLSRAGAFGVVAADEALRAAGVETWPYDPYERGVAMGASVGRPELQELVDIAALRDRSGGAEILPQPPAAVLARNQNVPTATMASLMGAQGPVFSTSTACSASGHAIGEAFRMVQEGEVRVILAGGFDALTTWLDLLGFSLLGALTTDHDDEPARASRPFDAHRSGFVIGEGAVVFVLEDLEGALARKATILAELAGYASTLNAYRITDAPPDGGGAIPAMAGALAEAGMAPVDVDLVVAHGTSTRGNDVSETIAIKKVLGPRAYEVLVSSPKSMTGHLTAASAGLNLLVAVRAMHDSVVPPTTNLDTPDPALDLDYVPLRARCGPVRAALVNAFAFGGTNTSLAVRGMAADNASGSRGAS